MGIKPGTSYNPESGELRFNVFSKNASCVKIYFYTAPFNADEILIKELTKTGDFWSLSLSICELRAAGISGSYVYYGYRAWGSNWVHAGEWSKGSGAGFICDVDGEGNRFNPNKLLIDPYSRELSHDPQVARLYMDPNAYSDEYYGGENRCADTGRIAPKSVMLLDIRTLDYGVKPKRHLKDDIIYEVNLRGLTGRDEEIPENERGTFRGAAKKAAYLKNLGVTAVEFLPLQEFADEQNDDGDPRGDNYWGYMTINYFSPNRRYSCDKSPGGPTREFVEMVKAFHAEGIKVFLDVVYNHTGEGILKRKICQGNPSSREEREDAIREAGPSRGTDALQDYNSACILSYAGLDNRSYYFLRDGNRRYEGRGACGGNLNYDNAVVKNLIIDSLRYWAHEMGVDGFRFDLAPVLSVTGSDGAYYPDENTRIFSEISAALPSRTVSFERGIDLIAEPWGEGSASDWTGKFPDDWAVWSRAFRDTVKTSMNKYGINPVPVGELSKVLSGSQEMVGKKPWNSINYIVSHDDCNSLRNLFSYNVFFHLDEAALKYDQISWDQGGDAERRKKAVRNAFALMMLSAGVPMFAGGDELFRPIQPYSPGLGKMNMVSVDSPDVWLDFEKYHEMEKYIKEGDNNGLSLLLKRSGEAAVFRFVKKLIEFRKRHAALRPAVYFTGDVNPESGLKDIAWYNSDGTEIRGAQWSEKDFIAYRIDSGNELHRDETDGGRSIYVAYNISPEEKKITLPSLGWHAVFDTGSGDADMEGVLPEAAEYVLAERSVAVFVER